MNREDRVMVSLVEAQICEQCFVKLIDIRDEVQIFLRETVMTPTPENLYGARQFNLQIEEFQNLFLCVRGVIQTLKETIIADAVKIHHDILRRRFP